MQFATLCLVVLLPLVPALILFKALPESKGDVSGTLHGLDIKLKGGFAGYFAMVVLILVFHASLFPPMQAAKQPFQVWTVTGYVTDSEGRALPPLPDGSVRVTPAAFDSSVPGVFTLTAYSAPDPSNSATVYPSLFINPVPEKYAEVQDISLDTSKATPPGSNWTIQKDGQHITLNIKMQDLPPYPTNLPALIPTQNGGN